MARGDAGVLDLDPSIRAAGTGGASNAAFWGGDPDAWGNPALLGYYRGARVESGRPTELDGSVSGARFTTKRYSANLAGIGVMLAGTPDRFGTIEIVDGVAGGATGARYARVKSWGVGVSAAEVVSAAMALSGAAPAAWARHFDVAAGMMRKRVSVDPVPPQQGFDHGNATDRGVLVRWTPVNTFDAPPSPAPAPATSWHWPQAHEPRARDPHERPFPDLRPHPRPAPRRVDFAYGYSVLDTSDPAMPDSLGRDARTIRHGISARTASGTPSRYARTPWLRRSFTPLVALSGVADLSRAEHDGQRLPGRDSRRYGMEVTFFNVVSLRSGHVKDEALGIDQKTSGLGLGFDLGDLAGARWDWARAPGVSGGPRIARSGFTAWANPVAAIQALRRRGRPAARR